MTDNPYAPSQASLSPGIDPVNVHPLSLSGAEIFSTSFRIMGEQFWPLCGLGILWYLLVTFAVNSVFGLVAVPHLMAGLGLAGYRYYHKQGSLDRLFDAFQEFGPILGAGLLMMLVTLAALVPIGLLAFGVFALATLGGEPNIDQLFETQTGFIILGIVLAVLIFYYVYYYIAARWILVYPLIAYFNHNVNSALSVSWKATSASSHTIAIQFMLFDLVFRFVGILLLCVGVVPAFGLVIAFHGAVCGPLLDHLYPEGAAQRNVPPVPQPQPAATPPIPQQAPSTQPTGSGDDRFKPPSFPSSSGNPYS